MEKMSPTQDVFQSHLMFALSIVCLWQCCEDPPEGGRHVLWRCSCGWSCNQGGTKTGPSAAGMFSEHNRPNERLCGSFLMWHLWFHHTHAGFEEAGRRQPAGFHELPVKAVRNAPEEVHTFYTQVVLVEMELWGSGKVLFWKSQSPRLAVGMWSCLFVGVVCVGHAPAGPVNVSKKYTVV